MSGLILPFQGKTVKVIVEYNPTTQQLISTPFPAGLHPVNVMQMLVAAVQAHLDQMNVQAPPAPPIFGAKPGGSTDGP